MALENVSKLCFAYCAFSLHCSIAKDETTLFDMAAGGSTASSVLAELTVQSRPVLSSVIGSACRVTFSVQHKGQFRRHLLDAQPAAVPQKQESAEQVTAANSRCADCWASR